MLFRGCEGDDYVPYQNPSGTSFTMEASDRNIVGLLRTWASSHSIDTRTFTSRPSPTIQYLFEEVKFTSIYESTSGL